MSIEIIVGYSVALSEIAIDEKKTAKFKEQLSEIKGALKDNREFVALADDYTIPFEERYKIIENSFKGYDESIVNTLALLAKKHRFHIAGKVIDQTINSLNNELNIKDCVIYSNPLLTSVEINKIVDKYEKQFKAKFEVKNIEDKTLIAGVRVVIGDVVIENSIHSQLKQMKEKLMKGDE